MKILLLGFTFLLNFTVHAADREWVVPETSLVMRTVRYSEEIVETFRAIMNKCHGQDQEHIGDNGFFERKLSEHARSFKENRSFLLLIYKDTTIVGGTYCFTEDGGRVVRLGGTSLDTNVLEKEESARALAAMIIAFGSLFNSAEKLVFYLYKNSEKIEDAKKLGFTKCDYPLPEDLSKDKISVPSKEY